MNKFTNTHFTIQPLYVQHILFYALHATSDSSTPARYIIIYVNNREIKLTHILPLQLTFEIRN